MTAGEDNSDIATVEAVVAKARSVYQRARGSGPRYSDVTAAVRALHSSLRNLHAEAQDPASRLRSPSQNGTVFSRELAPVLNDCNSSLAQLDSILENYGTRRNSSTADPAARTVPPAEFIGREEVVLALSRAKLDAQTAEIVAVLGFAEPRRSGKTAHEHASSLAPISPLLSPDEQQLEGIKAKIDAVALRLTSNQYLVGSLGPVSVDELWSVFGIELIYEGCPAEILTKHKASMIPCLPYLEALHKYLQEVHYQTFLNQPSLPPLEKDTSSPQHSPPTLSRPTLSAPAVMDQSSTASASLRQSGLSAHDSFNAKEVIQPEMLNEKFQPSVKESRPVALPLDGTYIAYHPHPAAHPQLQRQARTPSPSPSPSSPLRTRFAASSAAAIPQTRSANHRAHSPSLPSNSSSLTTPQSSTPCSSDDSTSSQDLGLMSTRDILAFDTQERDQLTTRPGAAYLHPHLLPQSSELPLATDYSFSRGAADHSPRDSRRSHVSSDMLSASPRYIPPLSPSASVSLSSPPPPYTDSPTERPTAAFGIIIPARTSPSMPRPRLAPDSQGNEIAPDAAWTKISRRLVSPEVLDRAGVRYEARPAFVAVLGRLDRAQIAEYTRQSAEARRARLLRSQRSDYPEDPRGSFSDSTFSDDAARLDRMQSVPSAAKNSKKKGAALGQPDMLSTKAKTFPTGSQSQSRLGSKQGRYGNDDKRPIDGAESADDDETFAYPFIVSPPASQAGGDFLSSGAAKMSDPPKSILKNKNTNDVQYRDGRTVEVNVSGDAAGNSERPSSNSKSSHPSRDHNRSRGGDRHRDSDSDSDRHRDRHHRDGDRHRDRSRSRSRSRSRRRGDRSSTNRDYHDDSRRDRDRHHSGDRERGHDRSHDWRSDSRRRRVHDDKGHDSELERERDHGRDRNRGRDNGRNNGRDSGRDRSRDRSRDRDRDRDHRHDRSQREDHSRDYRGHRDDHGQSRREDRARLRDTISAAGIGGAAASLLTVLSEAAHGL